MTQANFFDQNRLVELLAWAYKKGFDDCAGILQEASKGMNEADIIASFRKIIDEKTKEAAASDSGTT